jgi:uncharacterized protein YwqG
MTREFFAAALEEAGYGRHVERFLALCRPAPRLEPTAVSDDEIPVGASKFGGEPDAPADFTWPRYYGTPLGFLAQIRLEDVAGADPEGLLPASGLLSFFYDLGSEGLPTTPDERDGWRVFYFPDDGLVRHVGPISLPEIWGRFTLCALTFTPILTPPELSVYYEPDPNVTHPQWYPRSLFGDDFEGIAYWLTDLMADVDAPGPQDGHRFFGNAGASVHCVNLEAAATFGGLMERNGGNSPEEIEAAFTEIRRWRLLLQLDSDDTPDWMWGDMGRVYFVIHEDDLKARRWDQVGVVIQ